VFLNRHKKVFFIPRDQVQIIAKPTRKPRIR